MATAQELIDRLNELESQKNALDDAEQTPSGFKVGGKTYTKAQLTKLASSLDKDIKAVRKTLKPYFDARQKLDSASATGPGQEPSATQRKAIETAQRQFNEVSNRSFTAPALSTRPDFFTGATGGVMGPVATPAPPTPMEATTRQPRATTATQQTQPTQTVASVTEPTKPATTTEVTTTGRTGQKGNGTATTGTGTKGKKGTTVKVKGEDVVVGGRKWKKIIQEEFGSLWDIYNDNADVRKVIDDAVKGGYYNNTQKMTAVLSNTRWWKTTQASARQFMTRQATDPATLQADIDTRKALIRETAGAQGYSLSDEAINRVATDSIKYNYTETQVGNAIGSEAVAMATSGGPQGMAELRKGQVGTRLQEYANNYAYKGDTAFFDSWVQRIATGQAEEAQFQEFIKSQAASYYKSLAPQIDRGVDVKTATTMYRNQASQILGIDPDTVDWTQDKWNRALNYQDPKTGDYRQMDSWEWNRYLRSLPEWQNTDDAKQIYRTAAFSLAQAFGKTT